MHIVLSHPQHVSAIRSIYHQVFGLLFYYLLDLLRVDLLVEIQQIIFIKFSR